MDKSTMSGNDIQTECCGCCQQAHIGDFETAVWTMLSGARHADK
jgi:hypothetical protein